MDHPLRHTGDTPPDQNLPSAVPSSPAAPADDGAKVTHGGRLILCDLPQTLPITREEISLLRAYLGREIAEILRPATAASTDNQSANHLTAAVPEDGSAPPGAQP